LEKDGTFFVVSKSLVLSVSGGSCRPRFYGGEIRSANSSKKQQHANVMESLVYLKVAGLCLAVCV